MGRQRILPLLGLLIGVTVLVAALALLLLPRGPVQRAATVGGPFALTDQDGKTVTEKALQGHPSLVFFGYTHCPDICPATLAEISAVFKALGPDAGARAFFVTVDPQRDTPVVLKDYLSSFDPRITGLTGSPDAITSVETAYKVYSKTAPDKDGTYSVDHTAITYLMDKDGDFVSAFNLDRSAQDAARELKDYF